MVQQLARSIRMKPTFRLVPVVSMTALLLSGCLGNAGAMDAPAKDPGPFGTAVGPAASPETDGPGPSSNPVRQKDTQGNASRPVPVTFTGFLMAPDPSHNIDQKACYGMGGAYDLLTENVTWMVFGLGGKYDGWTFAFAGPGFVADFSGGFYDSLGVVPPSSQTVRICNRSAAAASFELTLTPPDSHAFAGHLVLPVPEILPGSCHLAEEATKNLYWEGFVFEQPYDDWSFHFSTTGLVATFLVVDGNEDSWSPRTDVGEVPAGAIGVRVCNEAAANPDYHLILSPPIGE